MPESPPHYRSGRRQPVALSLRYRRDEQGAALVQHGTTSDLGLGGAFIETDRPMPVGARVILIFTAPTAWEPLEVPAEVRWVSDGSGEEPVGFGVRFHSLGGATATALYELVHASAYPEGSE
jgi:uncharacterized protein (TIGR02266 family)